jgi:hypothetical protein
MPVTRSKQPKIRGFTSRDARLQAYRLAEVVLSSSTLHPHDPLHRDHACHLLVVDLEHDGAAVEDKCVGAAARFMIMALSPSG